MTTTTPVARPVLAWHGDPQLKADTVARMRAHREADTFVQGVFAEFDADAARHYRGCFHGCLTTEALAAEEGISIESAARRFEALSSYAWHQNTERFFGIPQRLGGLLDTTFENIPSDLAGGFALAVTEAIPVGADLSTVIPRLLLDLLTDETYGVVAFTKPASDQRVAVDIVAALYRRLIAGETVAQTEWRDARSIGARARAYTIYAGSVIENAAYAGIDASFAAYACEDAAYAYSGTTQQHRLWQAERLIVHIESAPVPALAAAAS